MGGVICLELGSDKPDNIDEIYNKLRSILDSGEHYLVSIYDKVTNVFMGDAEVIGGDIYGNIYVTSIRKADSVGRVIGRIVYTFNVNNTIQYYKREYDELVTLSVDDYSSIKERLTALENKLNELTE